MRMRLRRHEKVSLDFYLPFEKKKDCLSRSGLPHWQWRKTPELPVWIVRRDILKDQTISSIYFAANLL